MRFATFAERKATLIFPAIQTQLEEVVLNLPRPRRVGFSGSDPG